MSDNQSSAESVTERQTLDVPEVAKILGCSRGSAYRWVRENRIPALRIGRRIVVPRQAFERWLQTASLPETPHVAPLIDNEETVR